MDLVISTIADISECLLGTWMLLGDFLTDDFIFLLFFTFSLTLHL